MIEALRRSRLFLLHLDPGHLYLRNAVRGTIAVIACYFCVFQLMRLLQSATSLPFLAVLITMMISVVVNDTTKREQKITVLAMALPATVAALLAVVLAPWPYVKLVGFLLCTFGAVSIRRFGTRWQALGVVMFMSYYAALFFPFKLHDVPAIAIAMVIATALAYAARFWLLPDRPQTVLPQMILGFDHQRALTLKQIARGLRASAGRPEATEILEEEWLKVRQRFTEMNELIILIDAQLENSDTPSLRSKFHTLQIKLFEQEMALRRLWDFAFDMRTMEGRSPELLRAAAKAIDELRHGRTRVDVNALRPEAWGRDFAELAQAPTVGQFLHALRNLHKTLEAQDFGPDDVSLALQGVKEDPRPPAPAPAVDAEEMHINTRQAIQATLATTIASLLGTSVSPQRWYWTSIAAFMVFIGTTRGETMIRAVLRVIGTVIGLLLGLALAYETSGHHTLEWTLTVAFVFLGIFASKFNFGFWSAWMFSAMFALLYDILGLLNRSIIELRAEETLIGAAIGLIVGAIVLPTSTHRVVRDALADFLRSVSGIILLLPGESESPFAKRVLIRRIRLMDKDLQALRLAANPIVSRGSLMKHGDIPGILHDASLLAHYLRHLSIHINPDIEFPKEEYRAFCERFAAAVADQAARIKANETQSASSLPWKAQPSRNVEGPSYYFERIELALASLTVRKV